MNDKLCTQQVLHPVYPVGDMDVLGYVNMGTTVALRCTCPRCSVALALREYVTPMNANKK